MECAICSTPLPRSNSLDLCVTCASKHASEREANNRIRNRKKASERAVRMNSFWAKQVLPGMLVVQKASGTTGEVFKVNPWGVDVWISKRGRERESWSWEMITKRTTRLRKRYPRPFRYPRLKPTKQCHCKGGKLILVAKRKNEVRCEKCKNLIGNESLPNRIKRATDLIRKKALAVQSKKAVVKRVAGPAKPKAVSPVPDKGEKAPGTVVLRPKRIRKKKAVTGVVAVKQAAEEANNETTAAIPASEGLSEQGRENTLPSAEVVEVHLLASLEGADSKPVLSEELPVVETETEPPVEICEICNAPQNITPDGTHHCGE